MEGLVQSVSPAFGGAFVEDLEAELVLVEAFAKSASLLNLPTNAADSVDPDDVPPMFLTPPMFRIIAN